MGVYGSPLTLGAGYGAEGSLSLELSLTPQANRKSDIEGISKQTGASGFLDIGLGVAYGSPLFGSGMNSYSISGGIGEGGGIYAARSNTYAWSLIAFLSRIFSSNSFSSYNYFSNMAGGYANSFSYSSGVYYINDAGYCGVQDKQTGSKSGGNTGSGGTTSGSGKSSDFGKQKGIEDARREWRGRLG